MTRTVAETRAVDQWAVTELNMPSLLLMENAGRSLVDIMEQYFSEPLAQTLLGTGDSSVLICCGKGNNGGDGFVMARHLLSRGFRVDVLAIGSPDSWKGDAAVALEIIQNIVRLQETGTLSPGLTLRFYETQAEGEQYFEKALLNSAVIVDALLGTGTKGPLRSPYDIIVDQINASGKPVFAVDLPSGLDADSGLPENNAVQAAVTGTLLDTKPGLELDSARAWVGLLAVGSIGLPF